MDPVEGSCRCWTGHVDRMDDNNQELCDLYRPAGVDTVGNVGGYDGLGI